MKRLARRLSLFFAIWSRLAMIRIRLFNGNLPDLVADLEKREQDERTKTHPVRLGRTIRRVLSIGPLRARCLTTALVHFQLLREQGQPAQLVIGLPLEATTKDAHAWVEIAGIDVGPPPGRGSHQELARYGSVSTA
jgi:hypothetical protein